MTIEGVSGARCSASRPGPRTPSAARWGTGSPPSCSTVTGRCTSPPRSGTTGPGTTRFLYYVIRFHGDNN